MAAKETTPVYKPSTPNATDIIDDTNRSNNCMHLIIPFIAFHPFHFILASIAGLQMKEERKFYSCKLRLF